MKPAQHEQDHMSTGLLRRRIEIANRLIQRVQSSDRPEKDELLASLREDIRKTEQALAR